MYTVVTSMLRDIGDYVLMVQGWQQQFVCC
jgi:hypothetical protein